MYQLDSKVNELPALSDLSSKGYRSYAISANPFVDEEFGFGSFFDEFHSTLPSNWLEYSPDQNTERIERILEREADEDRPFFLFANYMDAHYPYSPPREVCEERLDERLGLQELLRLNHRHSSVNFTKRVKKGDVSPAELDAIRRLYHGEVSVVDRQISVIERKLREVGLREETLLVVTADHGENLGEEDARGERRTGHTESISDHLLRVPLVVAHPDLDGGTIDRATEVRNVATLFDEVSTRPVTTESVTEALTGDDDVAVAECPADGGKNHIDEEAYPELPDSYVENLSFTHVCVGYSEDWKLVLTSSSERWAWRDGDRRPVSETPDRLIDRVERRLTELTRTRPSDVSTEVTLDEETRSNLEDLGYL